jgi:hypothetical protein
LPVQEQNVFSKKRQKDDFHLFNTPLQCVSIKFISKTQGTYNYTGTGSCDGYLVIKLVLFCLCSFPLLGHCTSISAGNKPCGYFDDIVMKWTGHSDYKAVKPYIDIADGGGSRTRIDQFT